MLTAHLILPLVLVLAGLVLIAVEVYFALGVHVVGIGGMLMIVFGIGYAFSDMGLVGGLVVSGAAVLGGGLLAWLLVATGAWRRFVDSIRYTDVDEDSSREGEVRARYLGKTGVALTPLRPSGVAEIEGERIEVATEGDFIAAGSTIRVVAMDRRKYFVRLAVHEKDKDIASQ